MMYVDILAIGIMIVAMLLAFAVFYGMFIVVRRLDTHLNRNKVLWGSVPVPDDMPGVDGCFVGACVVTGELTFHTGAMAHAHVGGPLTGWVCFREREFIKKRKVRCHELAHILSGQADHNDIW